MSWDEQEEQHLMETIDGQGRWRHASAMVHNLCITFIICFCLWQMSSCLKVDKQIQLEAARRQPMIERTK
jgi:hypothetical protein